MSVPLPTLLALAAIAGFPLPPNDPGCYRVRAKVEMIALPTATALRLLPRLNNVYQSEAACRELQRLVDAGGAELLEQPSVLVNHCNGAKTDSGQTIRWPSEFEPRAAPGTIENAEITHREQRWGAIPPYSFDNDQLGARLEVETFVEREDGDVILQNEVAAELDTVDGWREFLGPADPHGVIGVIRQPVISRYKVQGAIEIRPGAHKLLGTFTCAKPQPHVIVFIFSATATRLDSPPPSK